ncbi:MAG: molecular chaperone DnaJ [Spirochaetales bacterium]|nr:molecular chaperone DnaJ [Spirochaetales bacterium]
MAKRDCYEILGISKTASADEIKKAYRKLAMQYHPDRNPGDKVAEEKFKEASDAYAILSDENKRKMYDQYGYRGVEEGGGGSGFGGGFEDIFGGGFSGGFEDLFGSFFGGGSRRTSQSQRGNDLLYTMEITLEDAVLGKTTEISFEKDCKCEKCHGSGSRSGKGKKTCPTCHGAGQVRRTQGFFSMATNCPTCYGSGSVIEDPCSGCRGTGIGKKKISKTIKVPAGIDSGKKMILRGEGDEGPNGGSAGDLILKFIVKPHQYYQRSGNDLKLFIPITYMQAVLGDDINIKLLNEKSIKVKIPENCENGKILRIRNEGVEILGSAGRKGDLYLQFIIDVPAKSSKEEKALLEKLRELRGENKQPQPKKLSEIPFD